MLNFTGSEHQFGWHMKLHEFSFYLCVAGCNGLPFFPLSCKTKSCLRIFQLLIQEKGHQPLIYGNKPWKLKSPIVQCETIDPVLPVWQTPSRKT